jgi:SAM-dependent methyltransferase
MPPAPSQASPERDLLAANRRYYDSLWSESMLVEPDRFNTWPFVSSLIAASGRRLEVAPGLRPRLPIQGTQFVDISAPALAKLRDRGGQVALGKVSSLPFSDATFDLVCALDIIEHVEDDDSALSELVRVVRSGGLLLISTPLHPALWNSFDEFVGHKRRYEPPRLLEKLAHHRLVVEHSAPFGMQPRSSRLLDFGMWWLTHHRGHAMWWYNRILMPLGLRFQKELQLTPGMIPTDGVDEVLLVCRR